jgi:antirestriction protein ArdC
VLRSDNRAIFRAAAAASRAADWLLARLAGTGASDAGAERGPARAGVAA